METISQTRIQVKILSILGSKLDEKADCFKSVKFNISANLEELEQGIDNVSLGIAFVIITEPKVVKYQVEGRVDIQGKMEQIKKILAPHPSTRVPMVLYDVYQQVYASVFVLSKMIDAPSPSPELLSTRQPVPSQKMEEAEAQDEDKDESSPDSDRAESNEEIEESSEQEISTTSD